MATDRGLLKLLARSTLSSTDTTVPLSAGLIEEAIGGAVGMNTFKAAVASLVLAVNFDGSVIAGSFEDAGTAYMKGDYATASRLLRPCRAGKHRCSSPSHAD
jgi:hypothetical protein